jgi:hypothetical protein
MDVYIYFLQSDGVPFYVGQTINPRQRSRNYRYAELYPGQVKLKNKLAKLAREEKTWEMVVVEVATEDTASDRERWHIANLRQEGVRLCNVTDGGEAPGKWSMTEEQKAEWKRKRLKTLGGVWCTAETREKIGRAHRGKVVSPEARAKMSASWKRTPEQLAAASEKAGNTMRGRVNIKHYILTDPSGAEYHTRSGLSAFCREHNLTCSLLIKVLLGERSHHKGWTIRRAP